MDCTRLSWVISP